MKSYWGRFNIILALLSAVALLTACQSPENKMRAALRLHLEANRDVSGRGQAVQVYRENPFLINVDRSPFLSEKLVSEAQIVDEPGGFAIKVKFERRGVWLLDQYSTANLGKRFVIFSQFPGEGKEQETIGRWLAAPVIHNRITDGTLVFTPDASRAEALRIVRGLNNEARTHGETDKW